MLGRTAKKVNRRPLNEKRGYCNFAYSALASATSPTEHPWLRRKRFFRQDCEMSRLICLRTSYVVLFLSAITVYSSAQTLRVVNIKVEPKEAFIERRGNEQRINFDLLIQNTGTVPLRMGKIQVSVYDRNGALAFRRYLDENGVPSGISIIPNRVVPAGGSIDVFNPFYAFAEEMPLGRLHYEAFFEDTNTKEPNLLNFVTEAEVDVRPTPYVAKTRLRLPLKGRIYVFDGHDFYAHHRRQDVFRRGGHFRPNSVRYAYDLMIADLSGELYHGDRFVKENWFSYGQPVYAPAGGTVVDAANEVPENSYKDGEVVYPQIPDELDPIGLGNHVVIDHGDGEFSILVHMKPGCHGEEGRPRQAGPAGGRDWLFGRYVPTTSALHAYGRC
jgi:hypothetical protein